MSGITLISTDPITSIIAADWYEDRGDTDSAAAYRWLADRPMPAACDWRDHVTVLTPTDAELHCGSDDAALAAGIEQIIALSEPLTAAIRMMRERGGENIFNCGPQARNRLHNYAGTAPGGTAEQWRHKVAGWCLAHAWISPEAVAAHRDCCRYLGMDDAAETIHGLIVVAHIRQAVQARTRVEEQRRQQVEQAAERERRRQTAIKAGRPMDASSSFRLCSAHRRVLAYVSRNPGCCKYAAASAGRNDCRTNPRKTYYLVNTLIRQGYIEAAHCGNRYELTAFDAEVQ